MKAKTILFATDFSTLGDEALGYASQLARESGARLLIVHVQEPPLAYGSGDFYYGLPEPDTESLREMLLMVKPADLATVFEHRLLQGEPSDEIAALAVREKVDFIVIASHGRTGLMRLLIGSVAEGVMRKAPCPVLVVKPRAGAAKPRQERTLT